jgi:hypothetical protein
MRGVEKIASVKTALFQSPFGLLPEGRFYAKPQPSQVSSVMSQRIPIFFMPRCHFDLRQRADLYHEIFGKDGDGYHARSAVGFASLPTGVAVEIEAIFQFFPDMLVNGIAIVVPMAELATAGLLLSGRWSRQGALLSILLALGFAALFAWAGLLSAVTQSAPPRVTSKCTTFGRENWV